MVQDDVVMREEGFFFFFKKKHTSPIKRPKSTKEQIYICIYIYIHIYSLYLYMVCGGELKKDTEMCHV